jgi:hypothetical protein
MTPTNLKKLAFLCICVFATCGAALADTDCDPRTGKQPDVCKVTPLAVGHFNVTVSYNSESAYVGNGYVGLNILIQSTELGSLEIIGCESKEEPKIKCTKETGPAAANESGFFITKYKFRVAIGQGVDPKPYPLTLTFGSGQTEEVRLFVGVTSNLKVRVETDLSQPPDIFTGVKNQLQLTLVNDYANYPVNIRSVAIKSDPYGLIQDETIPMNLKIEPGGQRQPITVAFSAASMDFTGLISGFGTPRLIMNVTYDDGYGRAVSDLTRPVDVRVRPRDRVLLFFMFGGVLVGALIKVVLQRLQESGQITNRQKIGFVVKTMGIGLVVAVIAMVGRIQIVAFDAKGSYDKPLVIFAIALTGALGGAQILSTWLKKSENK